MNESLQTSAQNVTTLRFQSGTDADDLHLHVGSKLHGIPHRHDRQISRMSICPDTKDVTVTVKHGTIHSLQEVLREAKDPRWNVSLDFEQRA